MNKLDRRIVDGEVRVAAAAAGEPKQIRGYAAVFNSFSQPMMGFREIIRPGAFRKTLREADVRALHNHDPNFVLGRKSAGTLELAEDDKGLRYAITPPNTTFANDLMVSIDRGDVTQSSFGFTTVKDKWSQDGDVLTRELIEVKLFDVSPVTFPAYSQTEVSVRSLLDYLVEKTAAGATLEEEERTAILQVLDSVKRLYQSEPDTRHSGRIHQEPGQAAAAAHSLEARAQSLSILRTRLELLLIG